MHQTIQTVRAKSDCIFDTKVSKIMQTIIVHYSTFLHIRFPRNLKKGSWVLNQVKEIDVKLIQNADKCNFMKEYLKNKKNSF